MGKGSLRWSPKVDRRSIWLAIRCAWKNGTLAGTRLLDPFVSNNALKVTLMWTNSDVTMLHWAHTVRCVRHHKYDGKCSVQYLLEIRKLQTELGAFEARGSLILEHGVCQYNDDILVCYMNWWYDCCWLLNGCRGRGWLAGYQMALDTAKTAKSLLSQSSFAIGYSKDDLTLHTAVYAELLKYLFIS